MLVLTLREYVHHNPILLHHLLLGPPFTLLLLLFSKAAARELCTKAQAGLQTKVAGTCEAGAHRSWVLFGNAGGARLGWAERLAQRKARQQKKCY